MHVHKKQTNVPSEILSYQLQCKGQCICKSMILCVLSGIIQQLRGPDFSQVWPSPWIYCFSDFKIFAKSQPLASNFKNLFFHKVYVFWEGHKILQNLHSRFDRYYIPQIYGGDFAKSCGLLRIYELWKIWFLVTSIFKPLTF